MLLLLLLPVLKVDAHGAHVRGTKENWGHQKAGWLFLNLFSMKLAGLFSNKCIRTELEYMQLWREVIEHRSRASVVYLISNWGWKHKIRIFVACWMYCRLHAFWEDQTDPKFVCGGPNSISRTGPFGPSSKILGSPSQLDKAKLLLPVVYNYTIFRAMMSKDYPEIQHQFDPWHWIKVIWNSLLSFLLRFE